MSLAERNLTGSEAETKPKGTEEPLYADPELTPAQKQRLLIENTERLLELIGIDASRSATNTALVRGSGLSALLIKGVDISKTFESNLTPAGSACINENTELQPIHARIIHYNEAYYTRRPLPLKIGRIALKTRPHTFSSFFAIEQFYGDTTKPDSLREIHESIYPSRVPTLDSPTAADSPGTLLAMETYARDLAVIAEFRETALLFPSTA